MIAGTGEAESAAFTWVGAHGGAGESSLASASALGLTLTRRWPDPGLGWPTAVALVARSNAAGLDAAARMVQEVLSATVPDLELCVLVVVADAPGRLPKSLRTRLHELSGTVPAVVHVPWIAQWRETPYAPHPAASTAAQQVSDHVATHLANTPANTAANPPADRPAGATPVAGQTRPTTTTQTSNHQQDGHPPV